MLISCHPAIAHFIHQQLLSALPEVPTATEKNHADDAMSVESANSASDSQDGSPSSCCVHLAPAQWNRISLRGKSAAKSLLALLHPPNSSASDTTAISAVSQSQQQEETNNSAKIDYLSTLLGVRNVSNVWPDGKVIAVSIKDPRLVAWRTPASGFEGVGAGAADTKAKQRKVSAQLAHPPADLTSSPLFQENWAFQFKHEHDLNSEKHADKVTKWEGLFQTTTPFAVLSPPPSVATGVADIATATAGARAPNQRIVPPQVCPLWIVRKHSAARSHKTHKHCMVGFDIILPAAWGSLLFQTLQLRCGAAAVGSEEMDHLRAKAGMYCLLDCCSIRSFAVVCELHILCIVFCVGEFFEHAHKISLALFI